MIRLVDRLRHLRTPAGADDWDDTGVEDLAARINDLAAADDAFDDTPQASASRSAVLSAFAAYQAALEPGSTSRVPPQAGAVPGIRRGGRRPAVVFATVALMTVLSAAAVAAATPGGPLYETRVAAEELFLPSDPAARFTAELARLDERVSEAAAAAKQGNEGGVQAALNAYVKIADEAAAQPVAGAAADAQLALRVRAQLRAIAAIGADDPELASVHAQVQDAAGAVLMALGEPPGDSEPGTPPPAASDRPSDPIHTAQPSPGASSPGNPARTAAPNGSSGPPAPGTAAPATGGPKGSGAPPAQPSASGAGKATPQPSAAPPSSSAPRASTGPSTGSDGSSSSPQPSGGGGAAPSPSGQGPGAPTGGGTGAGQGGGSG